MGIRRSRAVLFTVLVAAGAAAVLYVMFGPPKLLASSDRPAFCVRCHVMESEYEAWAHAGAHRRKYCIDCHLPNDNTVVHYAWKTIDGLKDTVVFYSGMVPERIEISPHGEEVLQANCVRCHEAAVKLIDEQRKCWGCHRRVAHRSGGAVETL